MKPLLLLLPVCGNFPLLRSERFGVLLLPTSLATDFTLLFVTAVWEPFSLGATVTLWSALVWPWLPLGWVDGCWSLGFVVGVSLRLGLLCVSLIGLGLLLYRVVIVVLCLACFSLGLSNFSLCVLFGSSCWLDLLRSRINVSLSRINVALCGSVLSTSLCKITLCFSISLLGISESFPAGVLLTL